MLSLATDASDTHVGGVLQQLTGGRWQPLVFYSKKLSGAGTRYSTFDRELLAAFSAVRHFRFLLEGRQFRLLTDHKPLVTSLFRTTPQWSARQQRQLSFIAEFTSDIRHTPGQENVVADAVSRPPSAAAQPPPPPSQLPSPPSTAEDWPEEGLAAPDRPILAAIADAQPVYFSAMAAAQRTCPEVAEMTNSSTLQITTQAVGDITLLGDVSTGVFRPLVLIQHREAIFQSLHSIHHTGVRATRRLITARFCWPQMAKAFTQMARACLQCQRAKFTDTYTYNQQRYWYLTAVSPTSMWTWLGRCRLRAATPTCSLSSTGHRDGRRPSRSPPSPPPTAPGPSSPAKCHASECQPPSLQTKGPNSRPPFGRACATCSTSSTHPRQHTTLSQMGWSSGSTGG